MLRIFCLLFALTFVVAAPQVGTPTPSPALNIYPNLDGARADKTKCMGIVGGSLANGTPVDIYDCNGSPTQKWHWIGRQLALIDQSNNATWCLDAGNTSGLKNGVKLKIWTCYSDLPQQRWKRSDVDDGYTGNIELSVGNKCLDLTDGVRKNRNVLQVWDCVFGMANMNQIWTSRYV